MRCTVSRVSFGLNPEPGLPRLFFPALEVKPRFIRHLVSRTVGAPHIHTRDLGLFFALPRLFIQTLEVKRKSVRLLMDCMFGAPRIRTRDIRLLFAFFLCLGFHIERLLVSRVSP